MESRPDRRCLRRSMRCRSTSACHPGGTKGRSSAGQSLTTTSTSSSTERRVVCLLRNSSARWCLTLTWGSTKRKQALPSLRARTQTHIFANTSSKPSLLIENTFWWPLDQRTNTGQSHIRGSESNSTKPQWIWIEEHWELEMFILIKRKEEQVKWIHSHEYEYNCGWSSHVGHGHLDPTYAMEVLENLPPSEGWLEQHRSHLRHGIA